jgi:hypothetical protein
MSFVNIVFCFIHVLPSDVIGVLTAVGVEITNGSNTNRSRKVHIELDSYG